MVAAVTGQHVLISELRQGVLTLRLNRPAARNALSAQLRGQLQQAVEDAQKNTRVRVIVLTGTDPAFCAGIDLSELQAGALEGDFIGPRDAPFLSSTKPLIGAINGAAYTGGLELALSCHFLIASELAVFADTHAKFGLTPGWGLTVLLPEAIGPRRARQMAVTSEPVAATTALAWGLVNEVVPHGQLLQRVNAVAALCVANDPRAVEALGNIFDRQERQRTSAGWLIEQEHFLGTRVSRSGS